MTKNEAVKAVLDRMRSALGMGESPDGSNHNSITEWYNLNVDKIGNGPWCEMTVTWAMWTGGAKALKKGRAYTVYGAHDGMDRTNGSSWHSGTAGMQAGDQVYYDWNGSRDANKVDHTGLCEKVNGDGTFYALEGNTSNHLERKLRDSKYVAGYVRFDWARLADAAKPASPAEHPAPAPTHHSASTDASKVKSIQHLLEVTADGLWGPHTDSRALLMRDASRVHVGYPHNTGRVNDIRVVQNIVNTKVDGVWGPNTQAALVTWVKKMQHTIGVSADGKWGPATDNAFLTARKKYLMR